MLFNLLTCCSHAESAGARIASINSDGNQPQTNLLFGYTKLCIAGLGLLGVAFVIGRLVTKYRR
jgi:hypothetical protein